MGLTGVRSRCEAGLCVPSGGGRGEPVPLLLEAIHIPRVVAPSIFKAGSGTSAASGSGLTFLSHAPPPSFT